MDRLSRSRGTLIIIIIVVVVVVIIIITIISGLTQDQQRRPGPAVMDPDPPDIKVEIDMDDSLYPDRTEHTSNPLHQEGSKETEPDACSSRGNDTKHDSESAVLKFRLPFMSTGGSLLQCKGDSSLQGCMQSNIKVELEEDVEFYLCGAMSTPPPCHSSAAEQAHEKTSSVPQPMVKMEQDWDQDSGSDTDTDILQTSSPPQVRVKVESDREWDEGRIAGTILQNSPEPQLVVKVEQHQGFAEETDTSTILQHSSSAHFTVKIKQDCDLDRGTDASTILQKSSEPQVIVKREQNLEQDTSATTLLKTSASCSSKKQVSECCICDKEWTTTGEIMWHCSVCGETFVGNSGLQSHLEERGKDRGRVCGTTTFDQQTVTGASMSNSALYETKDWEKMTPEERIAQKAEVLRKVLEKEMTTAEQWQARRQANSAQKKTKREPPTPEQLKAKRAAHAARMRKARALKKAGAVPGSQGQVGDQGIKQEEQAIKPDQDQDIQQSITSQRVPTKEDSSSERLQAFREANAARMRRARLIKKLRDMTPTQLLAYCQEKLAPKPKEEFVTPEEQQMLMEKEHLTLEQIQAKARWRKFKASRTLEQLQARRQASAERMRQKRAEMTEEQREALREADRARRQKRLALEQEEAAGVESCKFLL